MDGLAAWVTIIAGIAVTAGIVLPAVYKLYRHFRPKRTPWGVV